jgi:hypothetical protein
MHGSNNQESAATQTPLTGDKLFLLQDRGDDFFFSSGANE